MRRLMDAESFCVESGTSEVPATPRLPPEEGSKRWYASFIVRDARDLASKANIEMPSYLTSLGRRSSHAWVFVGQNEGKRPLEGRPEHTDDLDPETRGTFHLQVIGTKDWYLRQGTKLRHVRCKPGDVVFLDTRIWFHRTEIPGNQGLSISVAFDFGNVERPVRSHVSNVTAILAARHLTRGTVILTEDDLPNAELPRSANANCCIRRETNGLLCLVANQFIGCGEVLAIPPSEHGSDSDDDGDDDDSLDLDLDSDDDLESEAPASSSSSSSDDDDDNLPGLYQHVAPSVVSSEDDSDMCSVED